MKIKESMVGDVVTVPSNARVHKAVKLMNKNKIGCLLVVDYSQTTGILTKRDILTAVVEKRKDPKNKNLGNNDKRCRRWKPSMELTDAAKLMFENKVKKLPVVECRQLVGLVTLTDIARVTSVDKKTVQLVEKLSNMHLIKFL